MDGDSTVLYAKILTVINQVITIRKKATWAYAKIVELRFFFMYMLEQVNSTLTSPIQQRKYIVVRHLHDLDATCHWPTSILIDLFTQTKSN